MAKLSAHGTELARRETPTARIVVMSDGNIMKNYGQGWKLWKRIKPGVDISEYARKFDARSKALLELAKKAKQIEEDTNEPTR